VSEELLNLLDLDLAYARVRHDHLDGRVFIQHPYERDLVEADLEAWLGLLREEIRRGIYAPSGLRVWPVPKGRGFVRPGGYLSIWDQVVYAACVGACLQKIRQAVSLDNRRVDFSYLIASDLATARWLEPPYIGWKAFRESSIARLGDSGTHVVKGDLTGYYENIALRVLASDLHEIKAPLPVVKMLMKCLRRWAQVHGRGIPQAFSASDILGKLYLSRIDRALIERGFVHHRYVDDFILFCESESHAKRATMLLTGLLRKRGLNIQTAKTAILTANDGKTEIDQVTPLLQPLASKFITEIAAGAGLDPEYVSLAKAESLLASSENKAPLQLIQDAYNFHCIQGEGRWNKSLFHYLLNRLANAHSQYAVDHAITLLRTHPEETKEILRYIAKVAVSTDVEARIVDYLRSEAAVYSFQGYQVIKWRGEIDLPPSHVFLDFVRSVSMRDQPDYLRAECRHFLGKFGTVADLDRLEEEYDLAAGPIEKAEILCSLTRLERSRRNALLVVASEEGEFPRRAAKLVSQGKYSEPASKAVA
jgi:hypothetical protein